MSNQPEVRCIKCNHQIYINPMKGCFFCDICRIRGPVVEKDEAVEILGGFTEQQIREICREEISKASTKPTDLKGSAKKDPPDPHGWREKAKRLNIPITQKTGGARKRVNVEADIAAKEKSSQEGNN